MHRYGVMYTVTIAVELTASSAKEALRLAKHDDSVFEAEWDRQDIQSTQIISCDDVPTTGALEEF